VAKDPKAQSGAEPYAQVVQRLREIVEALESGSLPLEASLERFAEGVQLVKRGEKLLSDAEKRIEQLLSEDGRTAPLSAEDPAASPARGAAKKPAARGPGEDEDVPF
jgi:exodeoxyribonuclease VII small subunit